MSVMVLTLISFAAAFAVIYLLTYVPIKSTIGGKKFSPRLAMCKLLAPFDIFFTLLLIVGGFLGLTAVGIGMMIFNVMVGIGISVGVIVTKKYFMPRWQKQFEEGDK